MRVLWAASAGILAGSIFAATSANAGGFAIREQSALSQGASFAGSAAGLGLSSMFWNPAAVSDGEGPGINSESSVSLILPYAEVEVDTFNGAPLPPGVSGYGGDVGQTGLVSASYYSYQLNRDLFVGLSLTSPFGLASKPDDVDYAGAYLARTTKLLTINATPTVGYRIRPGLTVAAGVQVQYGDARLNLANPPPTPAEFDAPSAASAEFDGDGFAYGATAGILYEPRKGTSIGLGYRSRLTQNLEGKFSDGAGTTFDAEADIELPDIVTLSMRQDLAPNVRLLGTVEWSNWSRFEELRVTGGPGGDIVIDANWSDGWLFSLGGEVDMPNGVTLRAGLGYEISPIDSAEKRLVNIPDNDRIWLSGGASFEFFKDTFVDLAYTHVFIEDGDFVREDLAMNEYTGDVEAHTDIVSVSLKRRW